MKKIILLFLAVFALSSCAREVAMDVVVGDAVPCAVSVGVDPETRADVESLQALLGTTHELRYVLEIYDVVYEGNTKKSATRLGEQQVVYSSDLSVVFAVKLPPTRNYQFVVWADIVAKRTDENETPTNGYYNTDNLSEVKVVGCANSDLGDAFSGVVDVRDYSSSSTIHLSLKRPFAKLRIVDTDGITNAEATRMSVIYSSSFPNTFNVRTGTTSSVNALQSYSVDLNSSVEGEQTLFTDFIFVGNEDTTLTVGINFYNANSIEVCSREFRDIAIARNKITTIKGGII